MQTTQHLHSLTQHSIQKILKQKKTREIWEEKTNNLENVCREKISKSKTMENELFSKFPVCHWKYHSHGTVCLRSFIPIEKFSSFQEWSGRGNIKFLVEFYLKKFSFCLKKILNVSFMSRLLKRILNLFMYTFHIKYENKSVSWKKCKFFRISFYLSFIKAHL